ncbi:UNVERIFIED_CONTAM: Zinc finger protein AZF2 [Sesamum calycinum]|uniref:Zinc finger protein AZF2 n=1 Tax=Sesamum calycinum TaxID=2727403 RepID=A0AAW2MKW4_9LAMI
MGEVQGQRYVCKICSKSCVSGKSLGGHMRVHLALISASKKAAKKRAEIKVEFEGGEEDDDGSFQLKKSSKNQSNSALPDEEQIKNCDGAMDLGDGDQNNSYELRENPKKSWRISDSKTGVSKIRAACKECGKEFPSLRALSGHMRSHSIKNRKLHQCKECGKGFDSMRAMFGHMKTHSKRSRVPDESADSLSELENLCPIRRKRSRIGYKSTSNPSLSSLNASTSAFSEAGEVEEVAKCLMMLSRGVKVWRKFDLVNESSDDDSVYFGAESSCKREKFYENDGDFGCDGDKKMKMSLSTGKLDYCSPCSPNAFAERNVSEFDDLDSRWSAQDEIKVDFEVTDETKVDLKVSDDGQPRVHKLVKLEDLNEFAVGLEYADDSRSSDSTRFAQPHNDLLGATGMNGAGSEFFKFDSSNKGSSSVDRSGLLKYSSENEADDLETLKDFVEKRRTCDKFFHSLGELGGHRARHKLQGNSSSMHTTPSLLSITVADSRLDQLECSENQLEQESASTGIVSLESSKSKEHECPICFKVFPSGQALGGHKRAHYTGSNESKTNETTMVNQEVAEVRDLLDLNFPVTADEGTKNDVGLNLWWAERSHEHEALVLTN